MPGTLERCDVVDYVMGLFLKETRQCTRRVIRRGRKKQTMLSEMPRLSEGVVATILNFVGNLVTEDGGPVCVGNNFDHLRTCQEAAPELAVAQRCSYGWGTTSNSQLRSMWR